MRNFKPVFFYIFTTTAIKSMRGTLYVECEFVLPHFLIPRSNYSLSILSSCSILTRRLFSNSDLSVMYERSKGLNIVTLQKRLDLLTSFSSIEASGTVSEGCIVNQVRDYRLSRTYANVLYVCTVSVMLHKIYSIHAFCHDSPLSSLFPSVSCFSCCSDFRNVLQSLQILVEHVPGRQAHMKMAFQVKTQVNLTMFLIIFYV